MLLKGLVLSFVSILQKHIDSLKEAFIDPPEPCEGRFYYGYMHFI